jgi:osmotically-inducible protein OsmY
MIRTISLLALAAPLFLAAGCSYDDTSYQERAAAARLANQGDYYEDQALASKVAAALTADPRFRSADIHVAAVDNIVTLSGYVRNGSDIGRAEDIAASVGGVRGVTNALTLQ